MGSSFFFGWMISSLSVPRYADLNGRKKVVFACSTGSVFVSIGLLLSRSLLITDCILFVLGLLASGNFAVAFCYNMEFFTPEWQTFVGTLDSLIHCSLWVAIPLYFLLISKNYEWLFVVGASMNFLTVLGFFFFMDESPLFLYNKN